MNFRRHVFPELEKWKSNPNRKPLIVRGARQVGKTTLVNDFAKTYNHYISLNLERATDVRYFNKFNDAKTIVDALFAVHSLPSNKRKDTLLFIDEIQESPKAIALLRYFFEDVPDLHVIAAGSLLEHVMHKVPSFPVGRITYLYIHPLNFTEYLEAKHHSGALAEIHKVPVESYAHPLLKDLFHEYAIIGGMPEVVKTYLAGGSISDITGIYEGIWATYTNDVEKYAKNTTDARVIKHIMNTAYLYMDKRIKFQNFGNSQYKSREVGEAMRNLNDARIIQLIYPTTSLTSPIQPDIKKSPRMQFLDTGLVNHQLNIQADMLGIDDLNTAFKGAIIPHLITQEMMSLQTTQFKQVHFWVREKAQSSSEVDLIFPFHGNVIPIEVKSGKVGKLKSLHQFVERVDHPYAVRMYAGEFSIEHHQTPSRKKPFILMNLPYYMGTMIPDYIKLLVNKHQL